MARKKVKRKVKRKAKRTVKRKAKRKTARRGIKTAARRKSKRRSTKVTPKQYKQFETMETMYHHTHPSKTKRMFFGALLLAIAGLLYFNLMKWEYILALLALFVLGKAFFNKKCC